MGQDKKSKLKQLLAFIQDLYDNPDYKDFAAGIQSFVLKDLRQEQRTEWSQQIADIYEYCLMKNLREQAEDLYKDFPMTDIAPRLVEHYVDMEESRRKNDFDAFGLNLYLQVELIVETLIKDPAVVAAYDSIRNLPPVKRYDAAAKAIVRVADFQKIPSTSTSSSRTPTSGSPSAPFRHWTRPESSYTQFATVPVWRSTRGERNSGRTWTPSPGSTMSAATIPTAE